MRVITPVTRLLGIELPIIQAGMSWASSCADLPLAVSRAGGLGVIAAGPMRLADLARAVDTVRAGTNRPFAVNLPLYRKGVEEVTDLLLDKQIPILIASQGGPARYLERFRESGTTCVHVVSSVQHAVKAAAAGVDAIIAVGGEAGGHPAPSMVSSLVMVRAIGSALPNMPLVASGGFADGRGLTAGLALGAGAVQFGTRFLASAEANVDPAYKQAVLNADPEDARAVGRGLGVVRMLGNAFTDSMTELERTGASLELRRKRFAEGTLRMAAFGGDVVNGKVEAGQSAGLVDSILPAARIIELLMDQYWSTLAELYPSSDRFDPC